MLFALFSVFLINMTDCYLCVEIKFTFGKYYKYLEILKHYGIYCIKYVYKFPVLNYNIYAWLTCKFVFREVTI
jgi:hypothetical protein